jgi:positive regulator of sigma E activity
VAGSFVAGDWLLRGSSDTWWPADVTRRLPYFALLACLIAGIETKWREERSLLKHSLLFLFSVAISLFVAWQMTSIAQPRWVWVSVVILALTILWTALSLPLPLNLSWLALGNWALVAGLTGGLLTLSGSASLGLVSVAFGCALGALALIQMRWKTISWQAITGAFSVALMSLTLSGQQFAELPISSAVLMIVSPLSVLLLKLPWLQQRYWISVAVVILTTLLLLGVAAWLAKPVATGGEQKESSNPYAEYYRK